MISTTPPKEIFYFIRKETTYTYDRDDNTNDDESINGTAGMFIDNNLKDIMSCQGLHFYFNPFEWI